VRHYQQRLSGPLLDRFDIQLDVTRVDFDKLTDQRRGETSAVVRVRVEAARQRQRERYKGLAHILTNSDLGPAEIDQFCKVALEGEKLLRAAMQRMNLSARAYHRTLKLSRTIADVAGAEHIQTEHIAEAIQYRSRTLIV